MSRVVLAMSGGVDSSVAAHLLLREGHEVIGVFMRHGVGLPVAGDREDAPAAPPAETLCRGAPAAAEAAAPAAPAMQGHLPQAAPTTHRQGCCSADDAEDARRVADRLEIPFYALNFDEQFGRIIDYFVAEYSSGRTPNPCVVCNQWLKFGKLFDYADGIGAEFVATGHYARITRDAGGPALRTGRDAAKDQSYALFGVMRQRLARMLLPVGEYEKPQIRAIAGALGLRVADKRDSQEICFVARGRHDRFVRDRRRGPPDTAGEIVTTDGRVVGRHEGIESFTVGQRKGLGVALGEPRFVVRIEPESRRVVLGAKEELARRELTAGRLNWLVDPPAEPLRCHAKIRYNSAAAAATARLLPDGRLHLAFDEPRYGVAPGQAVVLYREDRVLGGGWIE